MNSGHFELDQTSLSNAFTESPPGAQSFFSCLQHREVVANLRYGIEARKGLILCTGDPGIGKSTLLHQLERELGSHITCLVISDPHLSFTEIVRRLFHSLSAGSETDELASLERCRQLLGTQSANGRITALAFDDAQHLRDELLEQLRQNIIGSDNNDRDRSLVPVILIGRPEIKKRLSQPALSALGSMIALECRLQPLDGQEIVGYIRQRLRLADLPEDLFEREALGRIANYSGGNFRQVNALCDRALRTAKNSSRKEISSEIVDGAAKDLNLWQPPWALKENSQPGITTLPTSSPSDDPSSAPRERTKLPQDQSGAVGPESDEDKPLFNHSGVTDSGRHGSDDKSRLFIGSKYMVEYVRQRLRVRALPEELFEPDALQRIAAYSAGNFRQANELCDRAVHTAQNSSGKPISSEIVDDAASHLNLSQPRWARKENAKARMATISQLSFPSHDRQNTPRERFTGRQERREDSQFAAVDFPAASKRTFVDYSASRQRGRRGRKVVFLGIVIVLGLIAIAGESSLYSDTAKQVIGALGGKLKEIAGTGKVRAPEIMPTPLYELPTEPANPSPLPQDSSIVAQGPQNIPTPPTNFEEPRFPPDVAKKDLPSRRSAKVLPAAPARPSYDLETEVFKALQNRAIEGVRISISDNIVYLDGRVATERQRRAAEIAAQGVPGVRAVRNSIALK